MTISDHMMVARFFWGAGFFFGCLFFSRWLVFSANMVFIKQNYIKKMIKTASAVTVLISLICIISNDTVFVKTHLGVQFSYQNSWFFTGMVAFITLVILAFLILDFRWWRESEMKRDSMQAFMFLILTLIIAPVAFISDFILPTFTNHTVVPLASICLIPVAIYLYVSMRKNKTLSITVPNASGYIFDTVSIPTLVLNHKNYVNLENKEAVDFLGSGSVGKNITDIV